MLCFRVVVSVSACTVCFPRVHSLIGISAELELARPRRQHASRSAAVGRGSQAFADMTEQGVMIDASSCMTLVCTMARTRYWQLAEASFLAAFGRAAPFHSLQLGELLTNNMPPGVVGIVERLQGLSSDAKGGCLRVSSHASCYISYDISATWTRTCTILCILIVIIRRFCSSDPMLALSKMQSHLQTQMVTKLDFWFLALCPFRLCPCVCSLSALWRHAL
jgi:hypothetical protein